MDKIYGIHTVDALLRNNPQQVHRLWAQSGREDKRMAALLELARNQGIGVQRESRKVLDELVSGRHQGVVAEVSGAAQHWDEKALLELLDELRGPALLLVLDGVTDPHNLGACLRSADAAGVHAVVVPKDNSADLTPVARQTSGRTRHLAAHGLQNFSAGYHRHPRPDRPHRPQMHLATPGLAAPASRPLSTPRCSLTWAQTPAILRAFGLQATLP